MTEDISLNDHIFPVQFISMEKRNSNIQESVLLTCVQQLLSLTWPTVPKQPPNIDLGSSIEVFIRNLVAKNKLDDMNASCNLLTETTAEEINNASGNGRSSLDYNKFLQLLQTVINKVPTT